MNADASQVQFAVSTEVGGEASGDETALLRTVYFGEALRAVAMHVSETLLLGPPDPMLDLLDEAFDRLSDLRSGFSPEEFTIVFMSMLLELCDDDDEAERLRQGAMRVMVSSAAELPDAYAPMVEEARRQLAVRHAPLVAQTTRTPSSQVRLGDLLERARRRQNRANASVGGEQAPPPGGNPVKVPVVVASKSDGAMPSEAMRRIPRAHEVEDRNSRNVGAVDDSALRFGLVGLGVAALVVFLVLAAAGVVTGEMMLGGRAW